MYEVFLSYIIYCLQFYFMTVLIPFYPRQICGISLNRVKEFRNNWSKVFESEEDKAIY